MGVARSASVIRNHNDERSSERTARQVKVKGIYVKDIRAGEKVSAPFLVAEKNLAFSQKGAPYLTLRLRDRTGQIEGKIWENAMTWDKAFKKGDIIHILSRSVSYRDAVQLSIQEVRVADDGETDPADFFPAARRSADEMFAELLAFAEQIGTPSLKSLLAAFLQDEEIARLLKKAPAAKGFHHVYTGGLLEHTLSVTRLLTLVAEHYGGVNRDLVITGGILHDIGKIYEFSYDKIVDYSDRGRLVGHIVIGVEMLDEKIRTIENFPGQLAMELRHILLSHHGVLEYGSPKRPKTIEALMVHHIDDLDAKIGAFREFIEGSPSEESDWTPFHRLLDRFIYKGKKEGPP
jgi:3'-5' exoribonuclease